MTPNPASPQVNPTNFHSLLSFPKCRLEVLETVAKCREHFEAEEMERKKAILSQKYLALLFYTNIPPQRCKEYQGLHFKVFKKGRLPPPGNKDPTMPNCLYITRDGSDGYIQVTEYKTKKSHGDDFVYLCKKLPS